MKLFQRATSNDTTRVESQGEGAAAAASQSFVIKLCSVPTPIAIPQPRSPQLTHYNFFFGRDVEDGRELYWLHMGYFSTRAQAQKWLEILRGAYPNAFVCEAQSPFHGPIATARS
jgi:hypothetical protein